jgi:glyoxylase-like metal-dependent hydrolase (beta-lactamase superfamily II)
MANYISTDPAYRLYPVHGYHGAFHLLYDPAQRRAVLVDAGLVGEIGRLERVLKGLGIGWPDIEAILLTHGHLDHTGNLARIKKMTGAPLFAHPAEQLHIDGRFPYAGPSRLCGAMEAFGRAVLRYRPVLIDKPLVLGMDLPFLGGLRVIHLPGHTAGHCGFYSQRFNFLFSGDLFASYWFSAHLPPRFLNSCPELFGASLQRVQELSPRYLFPNHASGTNGAWHRRNFDRLAKKYLARDSGAGK